MSRGVVYAGLAFAWWGLFTLYFRLVTSVPPTEVLAHRVVWSALLLTAAVTARRQWAWLAPVLRKPKVLAAFAASAVLLSANWLTYIWSVMHGHVVDASLGYFITPLVNVLLGFTVLHERPRRAQWIALGLATAAVVWLTFLTGRLPWIALLLAASFGAYGLPAQGRGARRARRADPGDADAGADRARRARCSGPHKTARPFLRPNSAPTSG